MVSVWKTKKNYEVSARFADKGESAKTADRPDFLRMIDYCRKNKGKIQALIVLDKFEEG